MKKNFKLALALVLAAMMIVSMVPAMAATITLKSTAPGDTVTNTTSYQYYQILKADLSALSANDYNTDGSPKDTAKVTYYVDDATLAAALPTSVFTVTSVQGANPAKWSVQLVSGKTASDLVTALNTDTVKNAVPSTAKGSFNQDLTNGKAVAENLVAGYYLITASNGMNVVLETLADVTINEKNNYPKVDKKITGENRVTVNATTENDVSIGDVITYTVPVTLPADVAAKDVIVHDRMYKGLTLNASSLSNDKSITGLSIVEDDTIAANDKNADYNYYKIVIPAASVSANANDTITLTYTATLNDQAVIKGDNPNYVKLSFDNGNYVTPEHEVKTKTWKVEVKKVDSAAVRLAGVKFTLTRDNSGTTEYYQTKNGTTSVWTTTKTEFTTTDSGNIVFDGIDSGSYTLTETYTPDGYNGLTAPISVTVSATGVVTYTSTDPNNTATDSTAVNDEITVVNYTGATLPSTGGIGTTIFYVAGSLMVLAAAILLITKRRMGAND